MPAQRIYSSAFNSKIAAEHGKVGKGFYIICSGCMLGNTHAVQNACNAGFCIQPSSLFNIFCCNSSDRFHIIRSKFFHHLFDFFKPLGPVSNKCFIIKVFFNDDMHETVYPCYISTQFWLDINICKFRKFNTSWINYNQFCFSKGNSSFYV